MDDATNQAIPTGPARWLNSRALGVGFVLALAGLLALVYLPFLHWLGWVSWRVGQLNTAAVLVLFTLAVCLRDTLETVPLQPQIHPQGMGLLFLAFSCLWLAARWPALVFPLVLVSFCLAFAAVLSLLFGGAGARMFLPALGGLIVYGLLVGLFPALDWPLRATAARHSASLLTWLGVPVEIGLVAGRAPELILAVQGRVFVVAGECNGFGLLTSALLVATVLGFQYHLPWPRKIGLFLFAIPMAIGANFLRIVSICLAAPRVRLPYGVVHEGLGTAFYLMGLALVWYVAQHRRPDPVPVPESTAAKTDPVGPQESPLLVGSPQPAQTSE